MGTCKKGLEIRRNPEVDMGFRSSKKFTPAFPAFLALDLLRFHRFCTGAQFLILRKKSSLTLRCRSSKLEEVVRGEGSASSSIDSRSPKALCSHLPQEQNGCRCIRQYRTKIHVLVLRLAGVLLLSIWCCL